MAILVIQHADSCGLGLLGESLRQFGQRTAIVRPDKGQALPQDLEDLHGIVSLGGPQSVNDALPWVEPETKLLRLAHEASVPVLGLCLGAQLLSVALGGKVSRLPKPLYGWTDVQTAAVDRDDVLMAGVPWKTPVFCWNNEGVTTLPEGATVLQRSAACAVQSYRVGSWSYGIQYHPEWDKRRMLDEIGTATAAELAATGATAESLRAATNEHAANSERLAARFFEMCNLMLFPSSRLQPGLAARSPLHH